MCEHRSKGGGCGLSIDFERIKWETSKHQHDSPFHVVQNLEKGSFLGELGPLRAWGGVGGSTSSGADVTAARPSGAVGGGAWDRAWSAGLSGWPWGAVDWVM